MTIQVNLKSKMMISIVLMLLTGCANPPAPPVDAIESMQQEKMVREGSKQAGLPAITNFSERKILKALYELRDRQHATYTYTQSLDGKFHFLCNSIGYPIPYSAQMTNPRKVVYNGSSAAYDTLPQSEPNGIFSPSNNEASWVMCAAKGELAPVYIQQRVITSAQKISKTGEIDSKSSPSVTIPIPKKL
jgi:hypothetical protein